MFTENKIYRDQNYIIVERAGEVEPNEMAIGKTVYTKRQISDRVFAFTVSESGVDSLASGRINILVSEVSEGNWSSDADEPYTEETLTDFLRGNTGFNSALGGSGAVVGDILIFDGSRYKPGPQTPSTSLATDDQTINEPTRKIYLFDNAVSNMQLLNNNGSLVSQQDGYGKTDHVLHNTGRLGTAVQYSHSVYSRAASSSGVAKYHNYLNQNIIDVRQLVGKPSIGMYKYTPSQTEVVYLDGTNGRIRVLDRYEAQGLTGITKTTLNPTSITVTGGLITEMN